MRKQSCWILAILVLSSCMHPSASPARSEAEPDGVSELRAAIRPYQSLDSAVAAGYPRVVADCIVHEHHGAMGYHHVNRAYLTPTLRVDQPQILLYERKPDGTYHLNGVEFILPYRMYARDSTPPIWMGQVMHREDTLNYWYLHVWAMTNNPNGLFANFNPDVHCPGGGKLYTPNPDA